MFKKYQHVERFGNMEVDGIELGTCHVFPKIDGTNSSVWLDGGIVKAGSRNRELSLDNDNAGFLAWASQNKNVLEYLTRFPTHILYGEWLVPHTLKTYRKDAWRKFYVFDVCFLTEENELFYLGYDLYKDFMDECGIDYIMPIKIATNATYEKFTELLEVNNFLIEDGKGTGEGIVIKNYDYKNKFGRVKWAKIVKAEFKEKHYKAMGAPGVEYGMLEQRIVDDFCSDSLIEKTFSKIESECGGWSSRYIPRLLETVFHDLVIEELYNVLKKFKNPKIDFRTLRHIAINKIKDVKSELF